MGAVSIFGVPDLIFRAECSLCGRDRRSTTDQSRRTQLSFIAKYCILLDVNLSVFVDVYIGKGVAILNPLVPG